MWAVRPHVWTPLSTLASSSRNRRLRAALAVAGALVLLTAAVYAPAVGNGFVDYDDPLYVTANRHVRHGLTWEGFVWAWGAEVAGNWHPLTLLSHMADVELWGLEPARHHLTSLLLHAASAVALFALLRRLTGAAGRSAAVAALFAVHPLRVESVAWVAERKDVLSGLFFLLALLAWVRWTRRPSRGRYLVALAAFAAGLLAKPMLVTLPFVLLLLDVWPLGRLPLGTGEPWRERWRALRPLLAEKLPFVALALAASAVTLYTQQVAMASLDAVPLGRRIGNALVSYAVYLGRTFWPRDLAVLYPLPAEVPLAQAVAAAALLAAITALALARLRRWPWLAVGWLWFLGMLVPVIGLLQVGRQAMADRYTYLPSIGLAIALVWAVGEGARALVPAAGARRAALATVTVVAIVALGAAARAQVGTWRDTYTLFHHALEVTEGNFVAERKVGVELARRGDRASAERHLRAAVRLRPGAPDGQLSLGIALLGWGRPREALPHLQQAVLLRPSGSRARLPLARALAVLGRRQEARAHLRRALAIDPSLALARRRLAALERAPAKAGSAPPRKIAQRDRRPLFP